MKLFFLSSFVLLSVCCIAQPKIIKQATISTTTNVIAPDEEDVSQVQNQGQAGGFNFRNFGDGETKSTTYIKDDLVKTNFKSESFKGTVYRDNAAKITTTIFEIMGSKQGMRSTDEDQVEMKKKIDSMREERTKSDTNMNRRTRSVDMQSSVVYLDESKKIAGYICKKALIITDKIISKDTTMVWYSPEMKFPNVSSTGGTSGLGSIAGSIAAGGNFDKVDGFVMMYERNMPRGRKMEVKVTKVEIDKDIAAKEFEIPKDIEIKSMKEMSGQGNMRMFVR